MPPLWNEKRTYCSAILAWVSYTLTVNWFRMCWTWMRADSHMHLQVRNERISNRGAATKEEVLP